MYSLKNQLYLADSSGIQVDLVWIPSHRGIRGNEEVDDLAKLGARNGTRMDIKIPYTDTLAEPKPNSVRRFQDYLNGEFLQKGLPYEQLYRDTSPKTWYANLPLKREEITLINRIRSNHYNLNASLFRKNMVCSSACPCGDPHQDINHIIFCCPITNPKSAKLISFIDSTFPNVLRDIFPLLKKPSAKMCHLLAFLKSSNLCI
ncbi:hypothetical protein ALC60_12538 [Trachymyrmex zeteki]|uniref:RNase H type-1 domain-containing protein n=1 Tax=Mycetomoellerius zeteki TaxID=64791 RepID=A0A151WKK0_9HYME|nr:hypothetical protein ALC60_12538 [Trachymyrmex zeteki]